MEEKDHKYFFAIDKKLPWKVYCSHCGNRIEQDDIDNNRYFCEGSDVEFFYYHIQCWELENDVVGLFTTQD